tara:strand:- start:379 stop:903 length:525 start_codon:yes stop_codon:yes gene_type:complete
MEGWKDMGTDTLEQFTLFDFEKEIMFDHNRKAKKCFGCKQKLPLRSFGVRSIMTDNRGYLAQYCRSCSNDLGREVSNRRKNYPLPPDDYCCPICLRNEEKINNSKIIVDLDTYEEQPVVKKTPWRLDHCHNTNTIRGWLCNMCNVSMGQLGDDIPTLERAIKYLRGELNGSTRV